MTRFLHANRYPLRSKTLWLSNELDAERFSATPDHFATPPRPGVARKGEPQAAGHHGGIVDRDLGPRAGQILHQAWARRKAAVEGDPPGLLHRFACFALPACCGHFCFRRRMLRVDTPYPTRPKKPLQIPRELAMPALPGYLHFAGKTGSRAACPAAQTPLYVRPLQPDQFALIRARHGAIAASTR